jgi:hypothetical protein
MHIASPVIAAAPPTTPPANYNSTVTVTSVIHDADASRQDDQHRNGQPGLDPVGQKIQFDFHIRQNTPETFP